MTWAAWEKNCLRCRHHEAMTVGKADFNNRPCPMDTRKRYAGKRISPQGVLERMRSDWKCPAREV
jgi:hypothetical protein